MVEESIMRRKGEMKGGGGIEKRRANGGPFSVRKLRRVLWEKIPAVASPLHDEIRSIVARSLHISWRHSYTSKTLMGT